MTPASAVQKPERFDLYVEKLRSTCEMHGVGTGSSDNLHSFLQRLEEDRRFTMDFWGLVGKLSSREGGELSDEQMLTVVVAGVTGSETLDEDDAGIRHALNELRALLSGVDLHQTEPMTTARAIAAMQQDQLRPRRSPLTPSLVPREPANSGALQTQLEQTIQRLEQVNRQLTQSLAYLDERFRRLEAQFELSSPPPLFETALPVEEHPAGGHAASSHDDPNLRHAPPASVEEELLLHPAPFPPAAAPSHGETRDLFRKQDATKPRLVLEPIAPPVGAPLATKPNRVHSGPLFEYASQSGSPGKKVVAGLAVAALLAGSGFAWVRYNTQIRETAANLIQKIHPTETPPVPTPAPTQSTEAPPDESTTPTTQPAAEQASTPVPTTTTPQPAAQEQPRKTPEHAAPSVPQDAFLSSNSSAVRVPAAVMEKNLVVSRVPAYPEIAKASRVQGSVIVQALITKTGAVSRVHVVQGDTRLRTAAIDAIYRQRYRPYVVNGVPVDVVTTITMNFTPGQ